VAGRERSSTGAPRGWACLAAYIPRSRTRHVPPSVVPMGTAPRGEHGALGRELPWVGATASSLLSRHVSSYWLPGPVGARLGPKNRALHSPMSWGQASKFTPWGGPTCTEDPAPPSSPHADIVSPSDWPRRCCLALRSASAPAAGTPDQQGQPSARIRLKAAATSGAAALDEGAYSGEPVYWDDETEDMEPDPDVYWDEDARMWRECE
jgi:hypothetical protein